MGCGGRPAGAAAAADGIAEFREMFALLADPAGLLDMEARRRTAGRMEEAASRSGHRAGARMASILSDMFADTGDIADMPVEDGSLGRTWASHGFMMGVLCDTAGAYRDGGDAGPAGELEDAGDVNERQGAGADRRRGQPGAAGGPPGASLPGIEGMHVGRVCRDAAGEGREKVRARQIGRGNGPVFPPKAMVPGEGCRECEDADISAAAMRGMARGNIPEGYELVRAGGGDRWQEGCRGSRRRGGRDAGLLAGFEMEADGSSETAYIYLDSSMLLALANPGGMRRADAPRALCSMVRSGRKTIT